MMKVINRDEGGVRNYFAKATDTSLLLQNVNWLNNAEYEKL